MSQAERQGRRNSLSRWALLRTAVRVALEGLTPEGFQRVSGQQHHSHPVKSAAHTRTRARTHTGGERVAASAARRVRGGAGGGEGGVGEHQRRCRVDGNGGAGRPSEA